METAINAVVVEDVDEPEVTELDESSRLNEDELARMANQFASLNVEDRALVMASESLQAFLPETKALYEYIISLRDIAPGQLVVPLMSVLGSLGVNMNDRLAQKNFLARVLRTSKYREDIDWTRFGRANLMVDVWIKLEPLGLTLEPDQSLRFVVPGKKEKFFEIKADASPNAQFVFLTPECAQLVSCQTGKQVSAELNQFYIAVHNETLKFCRGQASLLDRCVPTQNTMVVHDKWKESMNQVDLQRKKTELEVYSKSEFQALDLKRKREELELESIQIRNKNKWIEHELKQVNAEQTIAVTNWKTTGKIALEQVKSFMACMKAIGKKTLDDETQEKLQAHVDALIFGNHTREDSDDDQEEKDVSHDDNNEDEKFPINVTGVLKLMKIPYDSTKDIVKFQKVGIEMKKLYLAKYGAPPGQTMETIPGKKFSGPTNQYFKKDIDMMKQAIEKVFNGAK